MDREHDHTFFRNTACRYFPCHQGVEREAFNCLFCYCPLYALGNRCGGHFRYTRDGLKDCSGCLLPHTREGYGQILKGCQKVLESVRRKPDVQGGEET